MRNFLIIVIVLAVALKFGVPHIKPFFDRLEDGYMAPAGETTSGDTEAVSVKNTVPAKIEKSPAGEQSVWDEMLTSKSLQEQVAWMVEQRYPEPELLPLDAVVANWTRLPRHPLPERVEVFERMQFNRILNGEIVAKSFLREGGEVAPLSIKEGSLMVASLGQPSMKASVELEKTSIRSSMETFVSAYGDQLREDVIAMRDQDTELLMADEEQVERYLEYKTVWHDDQLGAFQNTWRDLHDKGVGDFVTGMHYISALKLEDGPYQGTFDSLVVGFWIDSDYGGFPHRSQCLLRGGDVYVWMDPLPRLGR